MNCKTQSFTHILLKSESLHHPTSAVLSVPKDSQLRPRLLQRRHLRRGMGLRVIIFQTAKLRQFHIHTATLPRSASPHKGGSGPRQWADCWARSPEPTVDVGAHQNSLPSTEGRPCPGALMVSLNDKMAPLGGLYNHRAQGFVSWAAELLSVASQRKRKKKNKNHPDCRTCEMAQHRERHLRPNLMARVPSLVEREDQLLQSVP